VNSDGSKSIIYENDTIITELPALPASATEFERETAVIRIISYGNATVVMTYKNGTVALFENDEFVSYIVPPKSFYIIVTVIQNEDGSFTRYFSNGTKVWFGAPPSVNETAEIKAFRIFSIRSEPTG